LGDVVVNWLVDDDSDDDVDIDHRVLPRHEKTLYLHEEIARIQKDYLSPQPIYNGREFDTSMFRISRSRFQRIMKDIGATGNSFYLNTVDAAGKPGACFKARLLLPLKCIAYDFPPHCFRDYFSMSSTTLARVCCIKFDVTI
jgi:hypothetical protein